MSLMKRVIFLLVALLLAPFAATAAGLFSINSSGQIIDPNGAVFVARGYNITPENVNAGEVSLSTIQQFFPRTNFVRVSNFLGGGYSDTITPQSLSAFVTSVTSQGIVVQFSDYAGSGACRTGGDLSKAASWLHDVAAFYASNPYVWYETENECFDPAGGNASYQTQVTANYNAARSGAPNSIIFIGMAGGAIVPSISAFLLNSPNIVGSMTNVVLDIHPYPPYPNGESTQSALNATLQSWVTGWHQDLSVNSEPIMPVVFGELGNSCCGSIDPTAPLAIQAADTLSTLSGSAGVGFGYWEWDCHCEGAGTATNTLVDSGAVISPYGTQVQGIIATAAGTGPTPPGGGGGGGGGGEAITVNTIGNTIVNAPFTVSGSITLSGGTQPGPPPPPPPTGNSHVTCYSQAVLDSVAANITNQVNGDGVPECFTGTCYPITFLPGDLLVPGSGPTIAGGDFFTDNAGNTWALQSGTGEDGSGHWWGNRVVNGATVPGGPPDYLAAIRLVKGVAYIQHSKFGGWYIANQDAQTNETREFIGNEPGPGDFCN